MPKKDLTNYDAHQMHVRCTPDAHPMQNLMLEADIGPSAGAYSNAKEETWTSCDGQK